MNHCLRSMVAAVAVLAWGLAGAQAPDFDANPINCTDTAGAPMLPADCGARARADGYELHDFGFSTVLPIVVAPPFPPPPPVVVVQGSDRAFNNPVMQDLYIHIVGNTEITVVGAPVEFFVTGTLDGAAVVTFSEVVGDPGHHVSWDKFGKSPDVPAGAHVLDMHIGVIQLISNVASSVDVHSLYQVTAEVPEAQTFALLLAGLGVLGRIVLRRDRPDRWRAAAA